MKLLGSDDWNADLGAQLQEASPARSTQAMEKGAFYQVPALPNAKGRKGGREAKKVVWRQPSFVNAQPQEV